MLGDKIATVDPAAAVGTVAGLALAGVLVWAAMAKLRSPARTAADFASLGLRQPDVLARLVPAAEIAVAGLLVGARPWGAAAATALLVAFTTVLLRVLRDPDGFGQARCACFGGGPHEPVSWRTVTRNGVLITLSVTAALL